MPFITRDRRHLIEETCMLPYQPGDICYMYYKRMVEEWRKEPRWTTAHKIKLDILNTFHQTDNDQVAQELAWEVFFNLHVMPYELKKREENGDI